VTLAFVCIRRGALKVMGALISEALKRGHTVVLVWDADERKPGERVERAELEAAWPDARIAVHTRGRPGLADLLARDGAQALIGASLHVLLTAFAPASEMGALRAAGIRLYSVDYAFETLTSDPEGYRDLDGTFYMSAYQRELHWRVLADRFAPVRRDVDLAARSAVVGSTMLDQLARVDRDAVRSAHGIAPGQRVVLLMSLKMAVPEPWRRLVWGGGPRIARAARALATGHGALVPEVLRGNGYRALVAALRAFCRRQGAALVVKSREKNRDPAFVRAAGRLVERDDDFLPYTSAQLMAVADLCVHFQSGAVLEAVAAAVPSISVRVPQSHLADYPGFRESFGAEPGTLQRWDGVVWSMAAEETADFLARATWDDLRVDPGARAAYVERFLGFDDAGASGRVLDVIEAAARR